ncbi:hypothetical protein BDB01DRAFT_780440 [Pilobolus umbonatus]|nr:hypothetical protein BDB01DRAFT_780440 [Pilobolus umbonatus]
MSAEDIINDEFMALEDETMKVSEAVQAYQRKLMIPLWDKRRELAKKIPGFWGQVLSNSSVFGDNPDDNDIEAMENLTDFHIEFDEKNPRYRKVVAEFKDNDVFNNRTLTKEFAVDSDDEGNIISKSTIEYKEKKGPTKKRKIDEDEFSSTFLDWFTNDDIMTGFSLSEEIFPSAIEYYRGAMDDDDDEDEDEIELGSEESEEEEEQAERPKKKSRK